MFKKGTLVLLVLSLVCIALTGCATEQAEVEEPAAVEER
jgi:hypothetical protein